MELFVSLGLFLATALQLVALCRLELAAGDVREYLDQFDMWNDSTLAHLSSWVKQARAIAVMLMAIA